MEKGKTTIRICFSFLGKRVFFMIALCEMHFSSFLFALSGVDKLRERSQALHGICIVCGKAAEAGRAAVTEDFFIFLFCCDSNKLLYYNWSSSNSQKRVGKPCDRWATTGSAPAKDVNCLPEMARD